MGRAQDGIFIVVALLVACPAHAAVLCKKKAGAVIVRNTSCKAKETGLDLSQFGALGPKGDSGAKGDTGDRGAAGPFPDTNLPSGKTLRGIYVRRFDAAAGGDGLDSGEVHFVFPLASPPTPHFIAVGGTPPAECPGTAAAPEAAAGHLCVYEGQAVNVSFRCIADPVTYACDTTTRFGASVFVQAAAAGILSSTGTWAVTAP